jgi:hypothetical protein
MCRRGEPFPGSRNIFPVIVFRVFLFQLILAASVAWGQDASTGALRGVVLDAQGAAIYDRRHRGDLGGDGNPLLLIRRDDSRSICCRRESIRRGRRRRDFAGGSGGNRSGNAVDVQAEGGGAEGNDHSGGCSADGGDESEFVERLRGGVVRAGGAVVNVVTKSGTNQWHGSTFYFLRDSSLGGAAPAFVGFNPSDRQQQFGATIGGPIQRNEMFLFAGSDQHIFHVPSVVQFGNGQTVVVPRLGTNLKPLDYEICDPAIGGQACDQTLVFASAAQLSTMGGTFRAKLLGDMGFVKLDRVLTPHQHLSARLSTSRYYGVNNVFFDPASPITNSAVSGNGEEDVATASASLGLLSGLTPRLTSHLRVQFSRDLQQSFSNTTAVRTSIYAWLQNFGQSSILPRQTREHRLHIAETLGLSRGRNQWKFGGDGIVWS